MKIVNKTSGEIGAYAAAELKRHAEAVCASTPALTFILQTAPAMEEYAYGFDGREPGQILLQGRRENEVLLAVYLALETVHECGMHVTLSVEPPADPAVLVEIEQSYPEIDTLELITPEGVGETDPPIIRAEEIKARARQLFGDGIPDADGRLPAHGAEAVTAALKEMAFRPEAFQKTVIHSWVEFDGNMYLSQNAANAIGRTLAWLADHTGAPGSWMSSAATSCSISAFASCPAGPITSGSTGSKTGPQRTRKKHAVRCGISSAACRHSCLRQRQRMGSPCCVF